MKKEILLLNATHIGTTLCDFPLLGRIRRDYPKKDANLTVLLSKRNGVLKKYIEREFDCRVEVMRHNFTGLRRYLEIIKRFLFSRKKYDLGICGLEPRKTDHLLLWALCKKTIAYVEDNWHGHLITNGVVYIEDKNNHQSSLSCQVYSSEPISPEEWPLLAFSPKYQKIDKLPVLFISTQNNRLKSKLNEESIISILNEVYRNVRYRLIINSPDRNDLVLNSLRDRLMCPVDIKITEEFDDFLNLVNSSDVVFVGDGGVSHVAAWLNKSCVVLFGETLPSQWLPMGRKVSFLYDKENVNNINKEEIVNKLLVAIKGVENKSTTM